MKNRKRCRVCKQIRPAAQIKKDDPVCLNMQRCYKDFHFEAFEKMRKEAVS